MTLLAMTARMDGGLLVACACYLKSVELVVVLFHGYLTGGALPCSIHRPMLQREIERQKYVRFSLYDASLHRVVSTRMVSTAFLRHASCRIQAETYIYTLH